MFLPPGKFCPLLEKSSDAHGSIFFYKLFQNLRLSADEALEHPWLIRAAEQASLWSNEKAADPKSHQSHFKQTARRLSRHRKID